MGRRRQKAQITDLNEDFSYPTKLLTSASPVVSPTKVIRTASSTVPRKRKPKDTERNLEYDETWPETANSLAEMGDARVGPANFEEPSAFEKYFDAVLLNCAGFFHISRDVFVVQGWDAQRERATVGDEWKCYRIRSV